MNYRPIIKIINTAIINEKALFQAPTFLKKKTICLKEHSTFFGNRLILQLP